MHRGFESYIDDLAKHLQEEASFLQLTVLTGGDLHNVNYTWKKIISLTRTNRILGFFEKDNQRLFEIEQISFFILLLPYLVLKRPKAIYLGEYNLYCYLFKFRKLTGLKFSLVLYTGGQATPGLFDCKKDYVHHITDIYCEQLKKQNIPSERQFLIPHFINQNFSINKELAFAIKERTNNKKIVLTVGYIDRNVKRMDLFVKILAEQASTVFPIILGEYSSDTMNIKKMLLEYFGKDGYILGKVSHKELGTYYTLADLFILCSPKESFGLASVEALYFGKPVLVDDYHEARFVLQSFACFVNMKNEFATKKAIQKLLDENIQIECIERQKFVRENYTWESLSEKYLNMFNKITEN